MLSKSYLKSNEHRYDRIIIESSDLKAITKQVMLTHTTGDDIDPEKVVFEDIKDNGELKNVIEVVENAVHGIGELFQETGMMTVLKDKAGSSKVAKSDVFFVIRSLFKALSQEDMDEFNNSGFAGRVVNLTLEVTEELVNNDKLLDFKGLEIKTETHLCIYVS